MIKMVSSLWNTTNLLNISKIFKFVTTDLVEFTMESVSKDLIPELASKSLFPLQEHTTSKSLKNPLEQLVSTYKIMSLPTDSIIRHH